MLACHGPGRQTFAIMYPHKENVLFTTPTPWALLTTFAAFSATHLQLYHTFEAPIYYPCRRTGHLMIFFNLQQPNSPYGNSTCLHRRDSATTDQAPLLHLLVSKRMDVFINDKEALVQAICTRASFTHAACTCAIQPPKCYTQTYVSALRLPEGESAVLQKYK